MYARNTPTLLAPSADNPSWATPRIRRATTSTPRPPNRQASPFRGPMGPLSLSRLHQKLRLLRRETPMHSQPKAEEPDLGAIANELELIGAKANTLAVELRHAANTDGQATVAVMGYLEECYTALAKAVGPDRPRWSRA